MRMPMRFMLFAGLYTWPLLTFDTPSVTFKFTFAVWALHVALIAATSFTSKKLSAMERSANTGAELGPAP